MRGLRGGYEGDMRGLDSHPLMSEGLYTKAFRKEMRGMRGFIVYSA